MTGTAAATAAWLRVCARHQNNPEGQQLRDERLGVRPRSLEEVAMLDALLRTAAARAAQEPAMRGQLDDLYAIYAASMPKGIQTHHVARTCATLTALLEQDVPPETLRQAIFMSRVRDFFSQMSSAMIGYLWSFFAGTSANIAMAQRGWPEPVNSFVHPIVTSAGARAGARFLRHAGMAPGWTRSVATDDKGQTVPAIRTASGFNRSTLAYWPFMGSLSYVTHGMPDPVHADNKAQRAEWALARQEARRTWNFIATLGVGAHRYLTAPEREITWLNALDAPGDPDGYRQAVMAGAIEELTSLEKTARSARWYVLARPFIGAWGALRLDDAWRGAKGIIAQYRPARAGGPAAPGQGPDAKAAHPAVERIPLTEAQKIRSGSSDRKMFGALLGVVAAVTLARRIPGEYPDDSRWLDTGVDILLLALWGVAVSSVEEASLDNPSIAEESRRFTAEWHLELAQAGGFRRVAHVPGAVNPNQVAPGTPEEDPEAPVPDEQ